MAQEGKGTLGGKRVIFTRKKVTSKVGKMGTTKHSAEIQES